MQDHAHLTRLPLEICEKIAAFLPARSLLSLGQTCRYLRIACHHPVVLQGSFMNYLDYPSNPTALLPDKEALRSLIAVQLATATKTDEGGPNDASVWLHLAFAASHLCPPSPSFIEMLDSLSLDDDLSSSPTPSPLSEALVNLVGTLSTFTIFGLPALVRTAAQLQANTTVTAALIGLSVKLSYGTFYRAQDPAHRDVLAAQAALCLATGSLQASAHPVPEGLDINMSILTQRVAHAFGFGRIIDNDPNEMAITAEWCRSLQGGQAIGLLAVASAAHLLLGHRAVQARNDLPRVDEERLLSKKSKSTMTEPGTGTATAVHIPLPQGSIGTGVLWADSIGTALRGYGAAAGPGYAQWLRENVDELIDDLSNGEWVGYYTYGAQTGSRVDAPLQGIHFTVEADPDDGDGVVVEAQGCRDGVGEFALNGKLSRTGGWVALRKTYTQAGFSWVNQGWLTPFGIAGYWGRELDGLGRGFVWMYKKEWTRGGAVN